MDGCGMNAVGRDHRPDGLAKEIVHWACFQSIACSVTQPSHNNNNLFGTYFGIVAEELNVWNKRKKECAQVIETFRSVW
ncbi:hypothetical protein TNCT_538761 [Trichonephila clavata]|uniref:Uncharacterized protein n=1 Tax=Trichonephila clavata TaxID=2740835 RepID=A0A8X6GEH4_TRICU|nr:hypothetical protein TNCT_538761 [Trichonephila clavata]